MTRTACRGASGRERCRSGRGGRWAGWASQPESQGGEFGDSPGSGASHTGWVALPTYPTSRGPWRGGAWSPSLCCLFLAPRRRAYMLSTSLGTYRCAAPRPPLQNMRTDGPVVVPLSPCAAPLSILYNNMTRAIDEVYCMCELEMDIQVRSQ